MITAFGVSLAELGAALDERLRMAGCSVPAEQVAKLTDYLELLGRWNNRVNLTAFRDIQPAIDRLIVEPALAARFVPPSSAVTDIGSGGGSPAIPLKVLVPTITLCMIEARSRKAAFLREAVRHLGLRDAYVEARRLEALCGEARHQGGSDVVTVRAVRIDTKFAGHVAGLLKSAGRLLVFRGLGESDVHVRATMEVETDVPLVDSLRSRLLVAKRSS